MFSDCPVGVHVVVLSETTLKAQVYFSGDSNIHSKKELQKRPVRADDQQEIHDQLQSTLPRTLYLQNLENLEESVIQSGCRDKAPSPGVLKSISYRQRIRSRRHNNETLSLLKMVEDKKDGPDEVLQKIILHPKGVMLWSKHSISIFHKRSKEDIVYLDATGSILKKTNHKEGPFYIYELVVRNPKKGSSPFPVATFVTCDHTTPSILYFLSSFQSDHARHYGKNNISPLMMMLLPSAGNSNCFHQNKSECLAPPVLQYPDRESQPSRSLPHHSSQMSQPCHEKCKKSVQKAVSGSHF